MFALLLPDQLRLAAESLRFARRVGIFSGFYVADAGAGETDGPPGAKVVGEALTQIGIAVDYITDDANAPLFRALGIDPVTETDDYLKRCDPTHLLAIERAGRNREGRYYNMRGVDVTETTPPLDELFLSAANHERTTVGIGDGGNEIGMGKVFVDAPEVVAGGRVIATVVATDFCIAAGISNWGAYGLAGALSVLVGRDLLPSAQDAASDIERLVRQGGAVDGVTLRHEATVDGIEMAVSLRMLESIRRQIAPSPLARGEPITAGILGYGETGRAAAALLARHGHRIRISDRDCVTLDRGTVADGVEAGGHSIAFLENCDLVVASPGVSPDSDIVSALHRRGVPVISELEVADQLVDHPLIAVTGTVGKRSTVELMQRIFEMCGRSLRIGGNRGTPLSALLVDPGASDPIAVAVSSFQLESVVHFRPHVAVVLNVDEAHLDRHRTVAEYMRIKSRVFMNQHHVPRSTEADGAPHGPEDVTILPFDDKRLRSLARLHQGITLFMSARQSLDRGAWLVDDKLFMNVDGQVEEVQLRSGDSPSGSVSFPENLLAAALTARLFGIEPAPLADALRQVVRQGGLS